MAALNEFPVLIDGFISDADIMPPDAYESVEMNGIIVGYTREYQDGSGYGGFTFDLDDFFETKTFRSRELAADFVRTKSLERHKNIDFGIN